VIAQEAEQEGWFRAVQGKLPSAAPFLTTEGPAFAFTFLSSVITGSCPGQDLIKESIPMFGKLNVIGTPVARNTTLEFSVEGTVSPKQNSMVYISGQNIPVTVPISAINAKSGLSHFTASFPFDLGFAKGLTVAAIVKGAGPYANIAEVAAATVFGPGIINVE
jgi:hypothetical protein